MKIYFIFLAMLCPFLSNCQAITIKGKVINLQNEPVPGATVTLKRTGESKATDSNGFFTIHDARLNDSLIVSSVGYTSQTVPNNARGQLTVILHPAVGMLDETIVIAYGTTTRRYATGSVSKVSEKDISSQPVNNPLAALHGRIPGLVVTQTNGVPGSPVRLQLRGISSIAQGSEPLIIIDGIPFAPGNDNINSLSSAASGLSPFHAINPADIATIEVLKDADATAIYGSRGANGVILITTKKATTSKTKIDINIHQGWSRARYPVRYLNTAEYIAMRREAFKNDNINPTPANAPDLLVWDTTRYTNMADLFTGNTASTFSAQTQLSGGTAAVRYLLSARHSREGSVFPGNYQDQRNMIHTRWNLMPFTGATIDLSVSYTSGNNNLPTGDFSSSIGLPPNLPPLFDSAGNLSWQYNGVSFTNPLANTLRSYSAKTEYLNSSLSFNYNIFSSLSFHLGAGYNTFFLDETNLFPRASINPASTATSGTSQFADNRQKSWILEPQMKYFFSKGKLRLDALAGATWQEDEQKQLRIDASGFASDALLENLSAATTVSVSGNAKNQYRYQALFGRIGLNLDKRYLLNISGRRDGSSRFGPSNRYGNFGAVGAGWLFSQEKFFSKTFPFISYGKLRGSWGITGNDQVQDYLFLDSWQPTFNSYQQTAGMYPSRFYNPELSWEENKKKEAAIELGFFKDRLLITTSYFNNRSGNQLVNYVLPVQTGFAGIVKNFPALVENSGWEFTVDAHLLRGRSFQWFTSFNLSMIRNRLVDFPGLAQSSYSGKYIIGKPLSLVYKYQYNGVDTATGILQFEDVNKDGVLSSKDDYTLHGDLMSPFFGGLSQKFSYKEFGLELFFEFRKQKGRNYLSTLSSLPPGIMLNQPHWVLERWQQPGDITAMPRFTVSTSSAAYRAWTTMGNSSGIYSDASYIRFKNIHAWWQFPVTKAVKFFEQARIYVQAQNIFTITAFKGPDPESQNLYSLPPLRTITTGIQITLK